jgi:hypothetical protein
MRICIGVDPGTETGFAVWDRHERKWITIASLSIIHAMEKVLAFAQEQGKDALHLRIEDARKITLPKRLQRSGSGADQGVGSVKRDSAIWEEFCQHHGLSHEMMHPAMAPGVPGGRYLSNKGAEARRNDRKNPYPKGKDCTGESFGRVVGWTGQTSGHGRDAAMWVWGM